MGLTLPLVATAAAVAAPFLAERLRPIPEAALGPAPGRFADLPLGRTHYIWAGPKGGKVAVLVHGLTTPSFAWEAVVPLLVEKGYRVLTYDHIGRGWSRATPARQDAAFFTDHLSGLLAHQGVSGRITLLGYSMGGMVVAAFAAAFPERVERAVLVTPGGLGHDLGWLEEFVGRAPLLGDWLMLALGGWRLRQGLRATLGAPAAVERIAERQIAASRVRGFLPSILNSQRNMLSDQGAIHRLLAASGVPLTAIWGDADTVIPLAAKDRLAALNPGARQVVVAGADHGLPYTHPQDVAAALEVAPGA